MRGSSPQVIQTSHRLEWELNDKDRERIRQVVRYQDVGCDQVVYVTRTGNESGFALGVARLLGMNAADEAALYDLDNPESSYSQSISEADGVWCTNWNDISATDAGPTAKQR